MEQEISTLKGRLDKFEKFIERTLELRPEFMEKVVALTRESKEKDEMEEIRSVDRNRENEMKEFIIYDDWSLSSNFFNFDSILCSMQI